MAGRLVSCSWISIFMNRWLWKAGFIFNTRLSLTDVNYNQQTMIDKFRTLTFSKNQTKKPCFTKDKKSHWTTLMASLRSHHCQTDTCFHKQELTHDVKDDFRPKSSRNHFWTINPLHTDISMLILHTVLHTFLKVLTRRIYITIKGFFSWSSFPLLSLPLCVIQGLYCKEKLDASHPMGSKGKRVISIYYFPAISHIHITQTLMSWE